MNQRCKHIIKESPTIVILALKYLTMKDVEKLAWF